MKKMVLDRKAGIKISLQNLIGLVMGVVVVVAIIFVFVVPGVSFFKQQALDTKMEKNLQNLKETIALADDKGKEIVFDAQGFALIGAGKNQATCDVVLPENCNGKGCVCVCKLARFWEGFWKIDEEGCIRGKCQEYDEDVKTSKDCGVVIKNNFDNLVVTKKDNIINIDVKGK